MEPGDSDDKKLRDLEKAGYSVGKAERMLEELPIVVSHEQTADGGYELTIKYRIPGGLTTRQTENFIQGNRDYFEEGLVDYYQGIEPKRIKLEHGGASANPEGQGSMPNKAAADGSGPSSAVTTDVPAPNSGGVAEAPAARDENR